MRNKLFLPLDSKNPFLKYYAYVDTEDLNVFRSQLDQNIIGNELELSFHLGGKYFGVVGWVLRSQAKRFERAMEELASKMPLLGYPDYEDVCDMLTSLIKTEFGIRKADVYKGIKKAFACKKEWYY